MIEYKPAEMEYNIQAAVKNLRETYWSNKNEDAKDFTDAEDIIISAICHNGYELYDPKEDSSDKELPIKGIKVYEMSKDQAVDILQTLLPKDIKCDARLQKYYALKMAINSLKENTSDDCVSRKEVLNIINKECNGFIEEYLTSKINTLTRVSPESVHGEWIGEDMEIHCDRCGYTPINNGIEEEDVEDWDYCPICGSKMKE